MRVRSDLKRLLAQMPNGGAAAGATLLTYHRVGGGSRDELDLTGAAFEEQLDALDAHDVVHLDDALDALDRHEAAPRLVLTFDDGFGDVYDHAWPLLKERGLPFTIYLATRYVGGAMRWEGSTARDTSAPALTWDQLEEMVGSGLCTIGNHTHSHARPEQLTADELDRCTDLVRSRLGVVPRHFAYTWGVPVPDMEPALRDRFRSAATGAVGRNLPDAPRLRLCRVPVRGSDPIEFFRAKLSGRLLPERLYGGIAATAKRAGLRG